jgi:hypothetical protein
MDYLNKSTVDRTLVKSVINASQYISNDKVTETAVKILSNRESNNFFVSENGGKVLICSGKFQALSRYLAPTKHVIISEVQNTELEDILSDEYFEELKTASMHIKNIKTGTPRRRFPSDGIRSFRHIETLTFNLLKVTSTYHLFHH